MANDTTPKTPRSALDIINDLRDTAEYTGNIATAAVMREAADRLEAASKPPTQTRLSQARFYSEKPIPKKQPVRQMHGVTAFDFGATWHAHAVASGNIENVGKT
jgi:hypothetical protein